MANLTPEQLRLIQEYYSAPGNAGPLNLGGMTYQTNGAQGYGEDGGNGAAATGYMGYDPSHTIPEVDQFQRYGLDGVDQGSTEFRDTSKMTGWDIAAMLAIGGGAALGAGAFGGAAAGAGGGMGSGSGAFLGEGALSGIGAWDGALSASQMGGLGAAGSGAMGGGGMGGGSGAFLGEGVASGVPAWDAAAGLGGAAKAAASKVPGWVKPAVALAGGLLGSQGESDEKSETKRMDPRMDSYAFGGNGRTGLLQYAAGQLDQDMSPERQQQWRDMQTKGMGLLNTPQAGNGFAQFAGRKF